MTTWIAACQVSLSFTISWSLFRLMFIESMMASNHLILCRPFLLLLSIFPSIKVFFSELALWIRWPKYWSFNFSISPSNKYSGLISFRIDWFDLSVQGTLKSLLQHHSSKASILQSAAFFIGSFGICASKFPFLLIQFSITFSGKKSESWIKHSVVRMHACLLASTPFTAMCL